MSCHLHPEVPGREGAEAEVVGGGYQVAAEVIGSHGTPG